jgi:hypothetical protein
MLSRGLRRSSFAIAILVAVSLAGHAEAQTAAPARPVPASLFLSEGFQLQSPTRDQVAIGPSSNTSPNLELKVYGLDTKTLYAQPVHAMSSFRNPGSTEVEFPKGLTVAGAGTPNSPIALWSGMTTQPTAATLRDKTNLVDLSGPGAKIRWVVRTSGFHVVRPVVKLADGTMLVGDHGDASQTMYGQFEFAMADVRWVRLDPERVVTKGGSGKTGQAAFWYENPDLSHVDEVGFADLEPGSGHGYGGFVNFAHIEVYGVPVKR